MYIWVVVVLVEFTTVELGVLGTTVEWVSLSVSTYSSMDTYPRANITFAAVNSILTMCDTSFMD